MAGKKKTSNRETAPKHQKLMVNGDFMDLFKVLIKPKKKVAVSK
jgi:hypothetical protein